MQFVKNKFDFAAQLAAAILRMVMALITSICRLLGVQPPVSRGRPELSTKPADLEDAYRQAHSREMCRGLDIVSDIGSTVHRYAAAPEPMIRSAVDLSALTPSQQDWLMMLSEDDLRRLAKAGPSACEKAVSGKRCGVVGLTLYREPVPEQIRGRTADIRDLMYERIKQNRSGLAYGR